MRRWLLFAGVVVAALALVSGSVGFSTATADRALQVEVAPDERAYLGYEQRLVGVGPGPGSDGGAGPSGESGAGGSTPGPQRVGVEVTVTNQFPPGTELNTVRVSAGGRTVDLARTAPLGTGERATRTFASVRCGSTVGVEAAGGGVTVRFDRVVPCR